MISEKNAVIGVIVSSVTTGLAQVSQIDWLAACGVVTTCGLAFISLYQKFREEKRRQDSADKTEEIRLLQREIEVLKEKGKRWKPQSKPEGPPREVG